jgi:hypothetical protein
MKTLRISNDLALPLEAVTQKFAFLGRTGSGKTYGATRLCELMIEASAQVVALDPVGVWWGLRVAADGKGSGLSIPVFGGLHGDIPLDAGNGALVADLIAGRRLSAVLDVSQMLSSEQGRFATDFVTQLFQRMKAAPAAMHIFVEEAQEFVPQNVGRDETRKVHAFERLIKLGRNFGIGASLISQRPQEVNKKALNQSECLFAFQMTGPQERRAIESWVSEKGVNEDIAEVLPHLRVGEPHVWSPQWLQISRTIRISAKTTADVSSTPKLGQRQAEPRELSAVDLEELREKMAKTVEAAAANDPAALKKRVADLQRENADLQRNAAKVVEKAVLTDLDRSAFIAYARDATRAHKEVEKTVDTLLKSSLNLLQFAESIERSLGNANMQNMQKISHTRVDPSPERKTQRIDAAPGTTAISATTGGMRRMMIALAQRPGLSAKQLGMRASMSSWSGTFGTYLGKLRSNGWLEGTRDRMQLTGEGMRALGDYTPLPTGQALLSHWVGKLGNGGAARMLTALANAYPHALSKAELGEAADIKHTSGTFGTYLGRLRSLELIHGSSTLTASPELFG